MLTSNNIIVGYKEFRKILKCIRTWYISFICINLSGYKWVFTIWQRLHNLIEFDKIWEWVYIRINTSQFYIILVKDKRIRYLSLCINFHNLHSYLKKYIEPHEMIINHTKTAIHRAYTELVTTCKNPNAWTSVEGVLQDSCINGPALGSLQFVTSSVHACYKYSITESQLCWVFY